MLRPLLFFLSYFLLLNLTAQTVNCSTGLVLTSTSAQVGEEVTISVTTRQFQNIVGMQYNHQWNPTSLRFIEVLYNPDLSITPSNFNLLPESLNQGILNFAFISPSLDALNLEDETVLYQLRFELLTANEVQVETNGTSLPIEFIDASNDLVDELYFLHARISMANTFPTLVSACISGQECSNPDLGQITISPSGIAPISIAWSNPTGFSAFESHITGLASSSYQLVLTDNNGSIVEGDFYVPASGEGLEVQLSVDADLCGDQPDGAVSATVSGGSGNYTYQWSNGANTANLTALEAGTYALTVTDMDNGCSITAAAMVESVALTLGFFNAVAPSCLENADGALTINIEGPPEVFPLTYSWSNGVTTAVNNNLEAGWYSVTVTDANACSSVFSYLLEAETFDFSATVTPAYCQNASGSVSIQLPAEGYSFLWSTGATTASISDLENGSYSVTVVNTFTGCTNNKTYVLEDEELVTGVAYECFTLGNETYADITVAIWNASDAPYSFSWSNGEQQTVNSISNITVPANGSYSVTITSASGCETILTALEASCNTSQVDLYIDPISTGMANGETQCFTIKANNFLSIDGFQFSLNWDESKLTYNNLSTSPDLLGFSMASFNTNLTSDGILAVAWNNPLANGLSLADSTTLFELCLTATTEEETTAEIDFTDFPIAIEVVNNEPETIGYSTTGTTINLNGGGAISEEVHLSLNDIGVAAGAVFCVPIQAAQFVDIIGLQATISWDPTALQFTGVSAMNLPDLTELSFNNLAEAQLDGILRVLWTDMDLEGVSVSNGTTLFELCFIAIGDPGDYLLQFVDTPLPLQVVTNDYNEITAVTGDGTVSIEGEVEDAVSLRIGSTTALPGELGCVSVEAVSFTEVVGMQFSINWDNNRILFQEITFPETPLELDEGSVNITPDEGWMGLSWVADGLDPISLEPGTTLFELCFVAQSIEGPAGVIFSPQPMAIEFIRNNDLLPFLPVNGTLTVTQDNPVWPGDTNDDGVANHLDVLPIGLGYTATGASRYNPSISWVPQYAAPWPASTPTGNINFRHADTNGDGVVTSADTSALSANWDLMADSFAAGNDQISFLTGASLYVYADTLQAGVPTRLPIVLSGEELIENAYGIAFTLRYDPDAVKAGSIHVDADGWLSEGNEDYLLLYHDFPADGRVEIGMVRTDGQGVSGGGQIAELSIIMEDVILSQLLAVETFLRIEDVRLITPDEEEFPTLPRETKVLVEGVTANSEPDWARQFQVVPNPTSGFIQFTSDELTFLDMQFIDATGRIVLSEENKFESFDLSGLPAGIYQLRIATDKGVLYEKVIKH